MSSAGLGEVHASDATRSQSNFGGPNMHSGSASALTYYQVANPMIGDLSVSQGGRKMSDANNRSTIEIVPSTPGGLTYGVSGRAGLIHQTQPKNLGPVRLYQNVTGRQGHGTMSSMGVGDNSY